MKNKKIILLAALCLALGGAGAVLAAGAYGIISLPAPGVWTPTGIGVAKVAQVQVSGSAVADGTVVLSAIRDAGATTNQLVSVTCSSGAVTYNETNAVYIVAGDRLLRSGTATNGSCRIIVAQ